jgi:Protein of unknown function (DUF4031)
MTAYVDELRQTTPNDRWRYPMSCHLTADSHDELIAFARRLGLRRDWLQAEGQWHEHFDLNERKRRAAVRMGAVEESLRASVRRMRSGVTRETPI